MNLKMTLAGLLLTFTGFANAALITFDGEVADANVDYDTSLVDVNFGTGLAIWDLGYDDLVNVAYAGAQGGSLTIDFWALDGSAITLNNFDLANFLGRVETTMFKVYDLSAPSLEVLSNIGLNVDGTTSYNVDYTSTIGIKLVLGPDLWNVGVDNISLTSTAVPEPTTLAVLAIGLMGLGARRFKK